VSLFQSRKGFEEWRDALVDEIASNRKLASYFTRAHNDFGAVHKGFWTDVLRLTGKQGYVRVYLVKDNTSIGLNMRNAMYSALVMRLGLPVKEAKEYCLDGIIKGEAEANAKTMLEWNKVNLTDRKSFAEEMKDIRKASNLQLNETALNMGVASTRSKHENIVNVKVRISPEPSVSKDTETLLEKDKAIFADIVRKSLLDMEKGCLANVKDFTNAKKKMEEICYADLEAIVASMSVKSMSNMKFDTFDDTMRKFSADMGAEVIRSEFTNGPEGKIQASPDNLTNTGYDQKYTYASLLDDRGLGSVGSPTGRTTDNVSVGYKLRNNPSDSNNEVFLTPIKKKEVVTMKIERPVNVVSGNYGTVNVLNAGEVMLAALVREAKKEISANEDLAEISTSYAKKANELQKIIDLCVKQIDKVAK
jgi:hypothetical protein